MFEQTKRNFDPRASIGDHIHGHGHHGIHAMSLQNKQVARRMKKFFSPASAVIAQLKKEQGKFLKVFDLEHWHV
jgi:hypothetical protein